MPRKLYHIYNENFEITHAEYFEEGSQPENAVYVENCSFIKPMFNPTTLEVYEGANAQDISDLKENEIEILREKTRKEISALIFEHTQRFAMRGIQIPEDILQQYDEMRAEYQTKKQAILNR